MPMIDVYAQPDTFAEPQRLAQDLAAKLMEIEGVPAIPMFRDNTAAFVHTPTAISDVDGDGNHVRVQVLTNAGALNRDQQLAVVAELTAIVVAAGGPEGRTWVLLTEATEGGWGLWGHAHTNAELVDAARAEIGRIAAATDGGDSAT
jgi:phenylpyruvate tautomerase PptA (4-oxalocrotonate tautomerase family)